MKSKEERFRELIDDLFTGDYSIHFSKNVFPNRLIILNSKDKFLIDFDQKTGFIWISYKIIWKMFENEYNMSYSEIEHFIREQLFKYFKIKHGMISNSIVEDRVKYL